MERRLAAILAADVAGYSSLMEADEEATLRTLNACREVIDRLVASHHGRVFGSAGDSVIAEFASPVEAVRCAVEVQQDLVKQNADRPKEHRMHFRIGVNLGDIMVDGDNLLGDAVNVAARLEELAEPDGITISGSVHEQIRGKLDAVFEASGTREVKNITRPIHVWSWHRKLAGLRNESEANEALPLPDKPSIAVLPFVNMSGDPEQEYFADGITEDITTELSRFHELFVIARNTAFTYKGQTPNVSDVASELGVHFVLEGSVRKSGNRVRINVQLIDGQGGNHLWAERYDGNVEEIFDLQDEVTCQVVGAIGPHITDAELARMRRGERVFDEAHDLGWQAFDELEHANWAQRSLQPNAAKKKLGTAKEKAYKAIALNERCLLAYYVICMACWQEYLMQWSDDLDETRRQFTSAAEVYVSLAPRSHRSHFCSGGANHISLKPEAAARDYRHSIELNPNDALVHGMLAYADVQLGNLSAAKVAAEKSIRLNPKDAETGPAYLALAQAAFVEDDPQFRHWAEKAIRAQPSAPIRRTLMIAHAAEVGDQTLLDEHLHHINAIAPRFISRLLSGELDPIKIPQYREKFLSALRKAVLPE